MTNANQQVLTLAQQGLSAQEIAENLGYETNEVLVVLEQNSGKLKNFEDNNVASQLIGTEFERCLPSIIQNMTALALCADDEAVRFRASSYILDQQQGLKKPSKTNVSNTYNIVQLSENIKQARARVMNRAVECGIEPPANLSLVSI